MTCPTCLFRKANACDFFPQRRPLFVRCDDCKQRRRARLHIAGRVALVAFGAVVAIVVVLAAADGWAHKVAWEIEGLVGR